MKKMLLKLLKNEPDESQASIFLKNDKEENKIHYEKNNFKFDDNPIIIDYPVPKLESFGVIEFDNGEKYVFFTSKDIKYGMIDSDSVLYEVNFDD